MDSLNLITSSLTEIGADTVGAIIQDSANENHFFVYVAIFRDQNNKQHPSNLQLNSARDVLGTHGLKVEFLLSDAISHDIEAGLRATIIHAFGGHVRNVFLSIESRKANIWLDPKKDLDADFLSQVESKTRRFLVDLDLELGSLLTTTNDNLPGKLVCLKVIRQLAPVSVNDLAKELLRREFTVPSDDWMTRRLDMLRKSHQVVRLANAKYVLSHSALSNLGTLRSGKSPDVSKMLALTRMVG